MYERRSSFVVRFHRRSLLPKYPSNRNASLPCSAGYTVAHSNSHTSKSGYENDKENDQNLLKDGSPVDVIA